jgi:hypothetical protein
MLIRYSDVRLANTYIFKPCLNCDFLNSDMWMHYFLSREVLAADKLEPGFYCKGS